MKTTLTMVASLLPGMASTAWGAVEGFEDQSALLCWIFLGFCALIVVAQLLPAILMMTGMAKGARGAAKKGVEKVSR